MLIRLLRFLFGWSRPAAPAEVVLPRESAPASLADRDLSLPASVLSAAVPKTESRAGAISRSNLSGLDTDRFAPMAVDDALAATANADWKSAFFDSRCVIPHSSLPRVQVIDCTMVGMGLISERELAEIHDIGEKMGQFRSDAELLAIAGECAVTESREDRQRRKEQRKADAEAGRNLRREQVTQRRATDIVFLGRGVSRGLADRRSNIELLQSNGLPVLSSPAELAQMMGVSVSLLRWLAFHSDAPTRVHYVSFDVPKKNGGVRRLSAPHRKLSDAQHWILTNILKRLPVHACAHGFVAQRSVLTNAQPHVGASVVINADLSSFFPTITFPRVEGLFRKLGYSPAVAAILALLCTECPRQALKFSDTIYFAATGPRALPQGASTSPAISNQIAAKLDRRMSAMASKLDWKYTRYADDLTWSTTGDVTPSVGYVLARMRHIVDDEGFELNHAKTRVQRPSQQQSVTGVVVNDRLSVPRQTIRQIRAILHNAKRTGLAAQNRDAHPHFREWLAGMIGWIHMVNPEQGSKLQSELAELS
ncbi:MAG: reverse transcriptase family protein [Planctomycetaceae bacterium]